MPDYATISLDCSCTTGDEFLPGAWQRHPANATGELCCSNHSRTPLSPRSFSFRSILRSASLRLSVSGSYLHRFRIAMQSSPIRITEVLISDRPIDPPLPPRYLSRSGPGPGHDSGPAPCGGPSALYPVQYWWV